MNPESRPPLTGLAADLAGILAPLTHEQNAALAFPAPKPAPTILVHPSVPLCLKESRDLLRDLELSQEWSAEMREAISDAIHNADNALRTLTP